MLWYTVGSTAYMFASWVITYLVVILSGAAASGVLSIAMSATNVYYTISIWGMRTYQVSDLKGKFSDNSYIMSRLLTCTVSVAACMVLVLADNDNPYQKYCTILYMVFRISEAVADVFNGIVQKHWRMDIIGKSSIARAVWNIAAFSVVMKFTNNILLAITAMMIGCYAVIIFYDIVRTVKIGSVKIKFDFTGITGLLIQCAPLVVCGFLYSLNAYIPRYYLKKELGEAVLGCYAAIASPVLIIQLLASYIFAPLIPLFSKSHTDHDAHAFSRLLIKAILVVLALSGVSVAAAYFLGNWGLGVLFGSKKDVLAYAYLLIPTVLTTICIAFIWLLNGVLTAIRQMKLLFISAVIGSVVCIVISKYCIVSFGANGVNISMIIVQLVQIVLMLVFIGGYIFKGRKTKIDKT